MDSYIRTYNIDSINLVPDSVYQRLGMILNYENPFDKKQLDELGVKNGTTIEESLFQFGFGFDHSILSKLDDLKVIAGMMLLFLRKIPVISRHEPKDKKTRELWGLYSKENNVAWIEIYPDLIFPSCKSDKEYVKCLSEVLIHELAHAVMDVSNYGLTDKYSVNYRGYVHPFYDYRNSAKTEECKEGISFYQVREESLANLITYRIIHESPSLAKTDLKNQFSVKFLKTIMGGQPSEYRLALYLLKANEGMVEGWLRSKSDTLIYDNIANEWMQLTSRYIESIENPALVEMNYCDYRKGERKLGVPWVM